MKRLNFSMPPLNWRTPWLWPRPYQSALWVGAGVWGALLVSPWWLQSWQAWDEAHAAKAQQVAQQESTQALRAQTEQLLQSQSQVVLADVAVLGRLAQAQGLQFAQVGLDKPQHSAAMTALHMQQLPVHLTVQGSWEGWLHWLAHGSTAAPGVTVASLELKADTGGVSAHVVVDVPQSTATKIALEEAIVNSNEAMPADPFSAADWAHAQRMHLQRHPSYARWVVPELARTRDWLETFPRERLQFVGQIASKGVVEALVKVLPLVGAQKDTPMMSVHRVRMGAHLGHNFGKVLAVAPDHLVLQELALMPTGEWQTREIRMPLQEALP
jgi:type IV pilus assembly protein PilP